MYYIYILLTKDNNFYTGYSNNLKKRIKDHNEGRVSSTKSGRPWKLLYFEVFNNKIDARREELFLKTGKGRERIKYLLKNSIKT